MFNECHLIKTQLNLTPNFLFQDNPKSKYYCKNELIYKRDFEAIQKTHSHVHVLSCLKTWGKDSCSFLKQYIMQRQQDNSLVLWQYRVWEHFKRFHMLLIHFYFI